MADTKEIQVKVERRKETGKAEVGRLRHKGQIPAVLYGAGKPPIAISVGTEVIKELLKGEGGENTIFLLKLKGTKEERLAMIKEIQRDPMSLSILHMDFIRVTKGHKLTVSINVEIFGDCAGVREGGRVDFITRELQVEVLPKDMFDHIEIDVSDLEIGDQITVADVVDKLPESAKFLEDDGRVILHVEAPKAEVEEEEEEGLVEAEGLITEETAEPELIKKGKGEDADED